MKNHGLNFGQHEIAGERGRSGGVGHPAAAGGAREAPIAAGGSASPSRASTGPSVSARVCTATIRRRPPQRGQCSSGAVGGGALIVCLANGEGAVSGTAAGQDLAEAAQGAAWLILSGWPFRMRYPRGLGLAFTRPGFGAPADRGALVQGAVDAALTAVKRLEGDAARLVLVVGSLCERVAAYGRGVRPLDASGSLVVVALGDAPGP